MCLSNTRIKKQIAHVIKFYVVKSENTSVERVLNCFRENDFCIDWTVNIFNNTMLHRSCTSLLMERMKKIAREANVWHVLINEEPGRTALKTPCYTDWMSVSVINIKKNIFWGSEFEQVMIKFAFPQILFYNIPVSTNHCLNHFWLHFKFELSKL